MSFASPQDQQITDTLTTKKVYTWSEKRLRNEDYEVSGILDDYYFEVVLFYRDKVISIALTWWKKILTNHKIENIFFPF